MTENTQDLIIKAEEKVNIEYDLKIFEAGVEEKMQKFISTPLVKDIVKDVKQTIQIKKKMEEQLDEFKAKVQEAMKNYNEYKDKIDNLISYVKDKTLEEATKHLLTTHKMDQKTGQIITKFDAQLPKGFIYNSGKSTVTYDEANIPDEYFVFTKVLDKKLVDEHIMSGKLPMKVRIVEKGTPYVTLREDYMKEEDETKE